MNKKVLLEEVIKMVQEELQNAQIGADSAQEEVESHKGAMMSRYDTFREEAQYLAGGQNARISELRDDIDALTRLQEKPPEVQHGCIYALIEVEDTDGSKTKYFLLPAGGGQKHSTSEGEISTLRTGTPVAKALIASKPGDTREVKVGPKVRKIKVLSIE